MNNPVSHVSAVPVGATSPQPVIGRLLVEAGKLAPADIERILILQKEKQLRFGEAALKLGAVEAIDVQHALARQFDYCFLRPEAGGLAPELQAAYRPFGREMEAMRSLRARLVRSWFQCGRSELALAGVSQGDGVSLMAANLAVMFAQQGDRTLLVDANLRTPRQYAIFNLRNRRGLADILAGRAGLESVAALDIIPSLSVLCAGTPAPNPQELLSRRRFDALRERLRSQYDVVLYDTPALATADDALVVAACTGGLLVVARRHRTTVRDMQALGTQLHAGGIAVAGAVLNEF
ncbi:MAG TPA: polysaccharide biosynthesis tyrosine autokinase [Noviherbaspirillum sp.]|jgi:chain length determinant protein tyrosine kinase EpsG|uniref:polysaccharide biosynthesis tyrosine autokinase n=1 Tax=Noviherbaspirillum sp. TaxID=1926288 RepID=UPI002F921B72